MASISIDQLAAAISDAVRDYTEDVSEAIGQHVDNVAGLVRNQAEMDAPKRTGKYSKGFKVTKDDANGKTRRIIWNKKHYRLVHLLEFGHAKRGGGRVQGRPHLRPAYDKHEPNLTNGIRQIIKNGG